jgi:hypothetical protein
MSRHDQAQLVVIDDSVRFAFHVWRYLGKSISIGSEEDLIKVNFSKNGTPQPLTTADGQVAIWWVEGVSSFPTRLKAIFERIGTEKELYFLIDMRGRPVEAKEAAKTAPGEKIDLGKDGERLGKEVAKWIGRYFGSGFDPRRICMVSSYETGVLTDKDSPLPPLQIWPKSPNTLARLAEWMNLGPDGKGKGRKRGARLLHILVTGAGFEHLNTSIGSFGLAPTRDLLAEMEEPFWTEGLQFEKPIPENSLPCLENDQAHGKISADQDLDAWWNYLLERELGKRSTGDLKPRERSHRKMEASAQERDMREAFRRVILKYDWGHMNQSLAAAKEDWHAWLTTNYTRFADRAIALVEGHKKPTKPNSQNESKRPWQIISTSIEAVSLAREILHGSGWTGGKDESKRPRYLFKLHGDIAHLQTMAIAGQDKEIYSSLSLPVDSLHQVYAAAATFLSHSLRELQRREEGARLVWHIVGHGLQDWLLLHLITEVCSHASSFSTDFIFVSRSAKSKTQSVKEKLTDDTPGSPDRVVTPYQATAEDYLARIANTGGLPERGGPRWVQGWLDRLGTSASERPPQTAPRAANLKAPRRSRA